ncbi:MAG: AAA-like domain-containing protein [Chitinispirillia bacterium]|nr:AAA-like domain-containing protein [Chitinispirillia bacterium]
MKRMKRKFNIAGPCYPNMHYMIDASRRLGKEVSQLIDNGEYFLIHASRQTGKTTLIINTSIEINKQDDYYALYCSLEGIQGISDPKEGIPAIVKTIKAALVTMDLPRNNEFAKDADYSDFSNVLNMELKRYCGLLDRPLVIFFDEADCLSNGTLILFLRQLRNGYNSRGLSPFVHSVALVGLLELRDYKALVRPDSESTGVASPFNIITKSMKLRIFSRDEIEELCLQHTHDTGQVFEKDVIDQIWEKTTGQPWLVNAIAREIVENQFERDFTKKILAENVTQAIETLIKRRDTHFDALVERLKEPRVRKIIQPLILGEEVIDKGTDDYLYTRDLGLIKETDGTIEPANPIYAELIVRALNWNVQRIIENAYSDYTAPRYISDGKIDMNFLIKDFQAYWRENSEIWKKRYETDLYEYDEAAPHLVLQAFLQRVINGGGQIIREMALGSMRADLCVVYGDEKYPVELKILQSIKDHSDSLSQISKYMDKVGSDTGWLVIFDRDVNKPWDEKIYSRQEICNGKTINIFGC